jgi:hypothetical protein
LRWEFPAAALKGKKLKEIRLEVLPLGDLPHGQSVSTGDRENTMQLVEGLAELRGQGRMTWTWQTRADWEAWHKDLAFAETRKRLEGLEATPGEEWWHEVVLDMWKGLRAPGELKGITRRLGDARERLATALIATGNRLRPGARRA